MLSLEFFPKDSPDRKVVVEITYPQQKGDEVWESTVTFSGAFNKAISVRQVDGVGVLYACFNLARREIVGFDPAYKHLGLWDIEGVLPETFPTDYGSDVYAQVKALSDQLVTGVQQQWDENFVAWLRKNPDWVKENRHLLTEHLLNRIADDQQ